MKKLILTVVITATFTAGFAQAQDVKPVPAAEVKAEEKKPDNEFTFNIGAASEYRYRGISQSRMDPAIQGGADYVNNPTGFYVGTWASSIKWIKDAGGNGNAEIDVYAGKKGDIGKGFGYDVGALTYVYPSNHLPTSANTTEIYGKLTYGIAYAKYSHSLTNLFGFADSKNSGYLDLGADIDLGSGYTLNLHGGHQWVHGVNSPYSYSDYKVGVSKQFFGVDFSLAAIGTDADKTLYVTPSGKFTGRAAAVLTATKTF